MKFPRQDDDNMVMANLTKIPGKMYMSDTRAVRLGAGAELSTIFDSRQMMTKVGFIGKIDSVMEHIESAPEMQALPISELPLTEADITLGGKVQKVAMRSLITRVLQSFISNERFIAGKISDEEPDGTVRFKMVSTPLELLITTELIRPNRAFQIVVGRKGGMQSGNWIIFRQGEMIPDSVEAVYLPRIDRADYRIRFSGKGLRAPLNMEFDRDNFRRYGSGSIIVEYFRGEESHAFLLNDFPQKLNSMLVSSPGK